MVLVLSISLTLEGECVLGNQWLWFFADSTPIRWIYGSVSKRWVHGSLLLCCKRERIACNGGHCLVLLTGSGGPAVVCTGLFSNKGVVSAWASNFVSLCYGAVPVHRLLQPYISYIGWSVSYSCPAWVLQDGSDHGGELLQPVLSKPEFVLSGIHPW